MAEEVFGFYEKDVLRIRSALEFFETFGPSLRNNVQRTKQYGTADGVDYIKGTLKGALPLGGTATMELDFPLGGVDEISVHGAWFAEKKGRRVGCLYDTFNKRYDVCMKICIDSDSADDDPSPTSDPSPPPFDPEEDPGPPAECPVHWCAYHWNGTIWEFSHSVGCEGLCPGFAGPPPEPEQPNWWYICCPDIVDPPGPAPMLSAGAIPAAFGVYDPAARAVDSAGSSTADLWGDV